MIRSVLVALILSQLAACGAFPPAGEGLPALEGDWFVTLGQSGGIVGVQRTVTITSDGNVFALDEREGRTGALQLSEAELTELELQVSAARLIRPAETETGCADCFVYNLEIVAASGIFNILLDDVSLPDSGLQPLITYVRDLMERALSTQ